MPTYFIQQKINTIAGVYDPFEHNGFHFEEFNSDITSGTHDGWTASKEVIADSVDAAFHEFFSNFYPLVDKIAFVTQCFTVAELEPYLVRRTDRAEFFLQFSKERGPVPLQFGEDELESIRALEQYEKKGDAFRYMREAINTPDFHARLAMLASALEGIAGETRPGSTNHKYIKNEILNDAPLHEKIFAGQEGIRNQLLHGKTIDDDEHGSTPYCEIMYGKIINYFNSKHGTKINTDVIGAPRTIGRSYNVWRGWLKPRLDSSDVDLAQFSGIDLHEVTKDFETLKGKPSDY
ncbi:MAG: hypothetical protein H8E42_00035 [Nitrospinae bacterium]|nr:hypothetical protein [Nitrospinota bacterium]